MTTSQAILKATADSRSERNVRWIPEVTAFAVILASHLPLVLVHFRRLWLYEHYHYFPLVIGAAGYFAWQRWPTEGNLTSVRMRKTEALLLATGFLLLTFSVLIWSSWLAAVAAIATLGGVILHFGGRRAATQLLPVWLLLWFLIPIPFRWDVRLIFELQTSASRAASYLLDFLGFNHLLAGHILEVPRHKFLVEEACSGIHSLFALLAFSAILMIVLRRSWIHSALLLVASVFWATSVNVIRVTSVVAAYAWVGADIATGWKHELLGLSLFGVAMAMLFSTDRLLLFLFAQPGANEYFPDYYDDDQPDRDTTTSQTDGADAPSDVTVTAAPDDDRRRVRVAWSLAIVFGTLGVTQAAALCLKLDALRVVGEATGKLDDALTEQTLPAQLDTWRRVSFERGSRSMTSSLGTTFSAWTYQSDDTTAVVKIDYPFLGWHHLPACYKAQGWQIKSNEMITAPSQSSFAAEVWQLEMVQPSGEVLHVRFSQFDAAGRPVRPEAWQMTSWRKLLRHNPAKSLPYLAADTSTYQIVMQVSTSGPILPTWREDLTSAFLSFREQLADTVLTRLHNDG